MGSASDYPVMKAAKEILDFFGIIGEFHHLKNQTKSLYFKIKESKLRSSANLFCL